MSGVGVTFGARDTGLLAMLKGHARATGRTNAQYKLLTTTIKEAEREQKKLASEGVRLWRKAEHASERYKREVKAIGVALRANKLTQEQANRAITAARDRLHPQVSMLRTMGQHVKGYLGTWLSIQAAAMVVSRELGIQFALYDESVEKTATMAINVRKLHANLGAGVTIADKVALTQDIVALAQTRTMAASPTALVGAGGDMVSATTGDFTPRKGEVTDAMRKLGAVMQGRPEDIGRLGGPLMAFTRSMTKEGVGLDSGEAFSLFMIAQSQMRTEDLRKIKNIVPPIKALETHTRTGAGGLPSGITMNLEDARLLIAAQAHIGTEAEDPEGEKSRTAIVKMLKVMEEKFPDLRFGAQLAAVEQMSPARQQEMFKELAALRTIGPIIQDFLRDVEKKQFRAIVEQLVIDKEQALIAQEGNITSMKVQVRDSAKLRLESEKEVSVLSGDLATAAAMHNRIKLLTETEGRLGGRGATRGQAYVQDFLRLLPGGPSLEEIEATAIANTLIPLASPGDEVNSARAMGYPESRVEQYLERMDRNLQIWAEQRNAAPLIRAPEPESGQ